MKPAILSVAILGCVSVAAGQVRIPDGFEIVQLTNDYDFDHHPRMNNCGQIVYSKEIDQDWDQHEIFLYDNESTIQITDNNITDWLPDINDLGTIVWTHQPDVFDARIWVLQGQETKELFPGRAPVINNLDRIAFKRYGAPNCFEVEMDIFFYDGTSIVQITDAQGYVHQSVELNDSDDLVWVRFNFCPDPWESDVLLYTGDEVLQLTYDQVRPVSPTINGLGTVAWHSVGPNNQRFVESWEAGETHSLTDWGAAPRMNDRGDVAFRRWVVEQQSGLSMLYLDGVFYQLSDGAFDSSPQDINNWGEVVIHLNFGYPHSDVGFLRRIRTGDSEFDGDVDADDYLAFESCFTGPGRVDGLCDCRFLDIDHDGDVDCDDWALFLKAWTGPPDDPPSFPACGCPADLNGDGQVGPFDLALLLGNWGPCPPEQDCPADLDGDGEVGPFDLALLLGNWGPCE